MKVISANLNGIRAAARKGFYEWLVKIDADIICLQELKAQPDQIAGEPYHPPGYHTFFHAAQKKGYSGVGIYCKQKPDQVQISIGHWSLATDLQHFHQILPPLSLLLGKMKCLQPGFSSTFNICFGIINK